LVKSAWQYIPYGLGQMRRYISVIIILIFTCISIAQDQTISFFDFENRYISNLRAILNDRTGDILVSAHSYSVEGKNNEINFTLFKRKSSDKYNKLQERKINGTSDIISTPQSAFDTTRNRYLLAWVERKESSIYNNISGARIGRDGKAKSSAFQIFPEAEYHREYFVIIPHNTKTPKQCYLIVFFRSRYGAKNNGLYYQLLNANGRAVGTPIKLTTASDLSSGIAQQKAFDIMLGSDGYYYVVFSQTTITDSIYTYQLGLMGFKPGGAIKKPRILNKGENYNFNSASITQISQSLLGVAWSGYSQDEGSHVSFKRYRLQNGKIQNNGGPIKYSKTSTISSSFFEDAGGEKYHIIQENTQFISRKYRANGTVKEKKILFTAPETIDELSAAGEISPTKPGGLSYDYFKALLLKDGTNMGVFSKVWANNQPRGVFFRYRY
jgi:hypothetical protein